MGRRHQRGDADLRQWRHACEHLGAAIAKNAPQQAKAVKLIEYPCSRRRPRRSTPTAISSIRSTPASRSTRSSRALGEIAARHRAARPTSPRTARPQRSRRQGRLRQLSLRASPPLASRRAVACARQRIVERRRAAARPLGGLPSSPRAARLAWRRSPAGGSRRLWPHLAANVLPQAAPTPRSCWPASASLVHDDRHRPAWLVTAATSFPAAASSNGRCCCRWRCRPTSSPSPIVDLLHPVSGPDPDALCATSLGWRSPRDYGFPSAALLDGRDLRPRRSCSTLTSISSTRAMFLMQARRILEVRAHAWRKPPPRLLPRRACRSRARRIAVGMTLALLEALNDIGASRISRRADADRVDLYDLGQPLEPGGRGADRLRHAADRRRAHPGGAWARRGQRFGRRRSERAPCGRRCTARRRLAALAGCASCPCFSASSAPRASWSEQVIRRGLLRRHVAAADRPRSVNTMLVSAHRDGHRRRARARLVADAARPCRDARLRTLLRARLARLRRARHGARHRPAGAARGLRQCHRRRGRAWLGHSTACC